MRAHKGVLYHLDVLYTDQATVHAYSCSTGEELSSTGLNDLIHGSQFRALNAEGGAVVAVVQGRVPIAKAFDIPFLSVSIEGDTIVKNCGMNR